MLCTNTINRKSNFSSNFSRLTDGTKETPLYCLCTRVYWFARYNIICVRTSPRPKITRDRIGRHINYVYPPWRVSTIAIFKFLLLLWNSVSINIRAICIGPACYLQGYNICYYYIIHRWVLNRIGQIAPRSSGLFVCLGETDSKTTTTE